MSENDWCDELDVPVVTLQNTACYYDSLQSKDQSDYTDNSYDYEKRQFHEVSNNWRSNRTRGKFQERHEHYMNRFDRNDFKGQNDYENTRNYRNIPQRGRGGRHNSQYFENRHDHHGRFNRGQSNYESPKYKDSHEDTNQDRPFETSDGLIDWGKVKVASEEIEREMFADLESVKKITYQESPEVSSLSSRLVKKIRQDKHSITLSALDGSELEKPFNPVLTFNHAFDSYPAILQLIQNQGFREPSPIQCQLWPILMSGHDAIGIAQTGTGKTLAYLLPGLLHIEIQPSFKSKERSGPLMLVLGPTRELVQQIHQEVSKFNYKNMKSVCVYGQGNRRDQRKTLLDRVEIVVATPGRLIDFVDSNIVNLREVSYLVLDEADRMLDLGFQPDIIKVTSSIRRDRQTVLTSATWPFDVEYIAKRLMKEPIKVQVGELDLAAVSTVTQIVEVCEEDEKFEKLMEKVIDLTPMDKIIIFTNRKATADYLINFLLEADIDSRVMHGGLEQSDREAALDDLKSGQCQILCATDVASRGLDITDLTKVINFDLPKNLEEYVHRSGRTGRAGKTGHVISFVTWDNKQNAQELIKILERSHQMVPDELRKLAERAQRFFERNPPRQKFRGRGRF